MYVYTECIIYVWSYDLGYRDWLKIKDMWLGNYSLRSRRLNFKFNFKIWSYNIKRLEF